MKPLIIPNKLMPQRYYTCVMLCLGLQLNYVMRFTLSIARLEMVPPKPPKVDPDVDVAVPTPDPNKKYEFDWDSNTQGLVMSSFFWGYLITQIPAGLISDMIGGKLCIVTSTFLSVVVTALHPVLARWNVYALIVGRVFLGAFQGLNYSSLHAVFAKWIPKEERSLWGSVVFTGAQIGLIECNVITGFIIDATERWDLVFYIGAGCAFIWAVFFQLTCVSDHTFYDYLKPQEQELLDKYAESFHSTRGKKPPWKQLWTSVPVWSYVVGSIARDWGMFAAATELPKYLASTTGVTTKEVGTWMALGFACSTVVALTSGHLSDVLVKRGIVSVKASRIVLTTLSLTGQAVFLVVSAYTSYDYQLVIAMLVCGLVIMGFYYPSLKLMPMDLSPNFAATVGAIGQEISTLSGVVAPYLINLLTPNGFISEWRTVFWVSLGVMSGFNLIYIFTMSEKVQPWNSPEDEENYKAQKEEKAKAKEDKRKEKGGDPPKT